MKILFGVSGRKAQNWGIHFAVGGSQHSAMIPQQGLSPVWEQSGLPPALVWTLSLALRKQVVPETPLAVKTSASTTPFALFSALNRKVAFLLSIRKLT